MPTPMFTFSSNELDENKVLSGDNWAAKNSQARWPPTYPKTGVMVESNQTSAHKTTLVCKLSEQE